MHSYIELREKPKQPQGDILRERREGVKERGESVGEERSKGAVRENRTERERNRHEIYTIYTNMTLEGKTAGM